MRRSDHADALSMIKSPPTRPQHAPVFMWTPTRRQEMLLVGVLLLLHWGICLFTARALTVTHDEIWHLPVGVRNLREGRFDIELVNPPLTRMWAAIPLVSAGVEVDRQTLGQALGEKFVRQHPDSWQRWYVWGRSVNAVWSLGTALLLYFWSRRLFGVGIGLLTLLLYVSDPNVTAHASVVTPDLGGAFAFLAALSAMIFWSERPGWRRALLWGAVLGIAQGTKFTNLLLYSLLPVLLLVQFRKRLRTEWKPLLLQSGVAVVVSLMVLAGCYRFQGLCLPLASYTFRSTDLLAVQKLLSFVPWLPVPVPEQYLLGIDEQRAVMAGMHPVFLDGSWSLHGFRSYFVKGLCYKLPHAVHLLLLLACLGFLFQRERPRRWNEFWLIVLPVSLVLFAASRESLQLGVRYVMPVIPLLFIACGRGMHCFRFLPVRLRQAGLVLFLVSCGLSLRFHPNHLSYFNEWGGGPVGGRFHLIDSNLDWGQNLVTLRDELQRDGVEEIGLAYFGTVPPECEGIRFTLPPSRSPQPGWYAVSVNFVMGRPHSVFQGDGTTRAADFEEFGYFRFFAPVKRLGGSIDLYRVTEADVLEWHRARQSRF